MTLWLVRAGKTGDREELALESNNVVVGWDSLPDLSQANSRGELDRMYQHTYPEAGKGRRRNHVGQLWAFSHRIKQDDLVVLPLKRASAIAIGRVVGSYRYSVDVGASACHFLPVEWLKTDVPRSAFHQDLLYSFGAFMTVCKIHRNNAEARVRAVLTGESAPAEVAEDETTTEEASEPDVEQLARDQISAYLMQRFKGHELTALVNAVLEAQGYVTQVAASGADGGVDILAGSGTLGFSPPRLCVQVKSQQGPADVAVFRGLQGSMQTFHAEQGLLVCWGGFNKVVQREARLSFFRIRLWDAGALLRAITDSYDKLPEDIQTELPLKRVWALVLEE